MHFLVLSCLVSAQEGGTGAAMAVPTVEEVLSSNGLGEGGDPSELEQKLAERVVELSSEVAELRKLNKARLVKDEKRRAAAARKEEAERRKKQEHDAKEKVEKDKAAAKVRYVWKSACLLRWHFIYFYIVFYIILYCKSVYTTSDL
eukprot:COSAG06_NODE_1693_length_8701_cov_80.626133_5_plen_146_part_00